jgi:hypothetical protein
MVARLPEELRQIRSMFKHPRRAHPLIQINQRRSGAAPKTNIFQCASTRAVQPAQRFSF